MTKLAVNVTHVSSICHKAIATRNRYETEIQRSFLLLVEHFLRIIQIVNSHNIAKSFNRYSADCGFFGYSLVYTGQQETVTTKKYYVSVYMYNNYISSVCNLLFVDPVVRKQCKSILGVFLEEIVSLASLNVAF